MRSQMNREELVNDLSALVFVDTSSVRSNSYKHLFGSREELASISKLASLIVPEMVVSELIEQRRRQYEDDHRKMIRNSVFKHYCESGLRVPDISFEDVRRTLLEDKSIPYKVIKVVDSDSALLEIQQQAIAQNAPFEGSGKGFKDAVIVQTINQYLDSNDARGEVFFVTSDNMLADCFGESSRVTVCHELKELLSKLKAGDEKNQAPDSVPIGKEDSPAARELIEVAIEGIEYCRSFSEAHAAVKRLSEFYGSLSADDEARILNAALENDQISQILYDRDMQDFFIPLFEKHWNELVEAQRSSFQHNARLVQIVLENGEPALFTKDEVNLYRSFSSELDDHVSIIDENALIEANVETVLCGLRRALSECGLEEYVPDAEIVIKVFVDGAFRYRPHRMKVSVLRDFVSLFDSCSAPKRKAIVENIVTVLNSNKDYSHSYYPDYSEDDIPF